MNTHLKNTLTALALLLALSGQFILAPQSASAAACDAALFIADVTAPDGAAYSPNAAFTKTWRLKNVGACPWTTAYQLVFVTGEQMSGPDEVPLAATVAPNETVDLSVDLTAPFPAGTYRGYWQLKNAEGMLFGLGTTADKPFWVEIVTQPGSLVTPVPLGQAYDFASSKAQSWISGAGLLPFPGTDGDARGFAMKLDSVRMETGKTITQPSLLMVPQNKYNGYIQALYPSLAIQNGDRFQTTIGCQYGATSCYVTYRIDYRTSAGVKTLWTFKEKYEGLTYNVDLDLSFLAGKNVEFFFLVLASGSPAGDRAVWIAPRIVHPAGSASATPTPMPTITATSPTPMVTSAPATATATPTATTAPVTETATPTPTATSGQSAWLTYTSEAYQFEFQYPPEGQVRTDQGGLVYIGLPVTPGTNLSSKYLQAGAEDGATSCTALPINPEPSVPVVFNGITFNKSTGEDVGAGQFRDWTNYYTLRGTTCISMGFVLHSGNIGAFPTPIAQFDFEAESAVFNQIMSTFRWLSPP